MKSTNFIIFTLLLASTFSLYGLVFGASMATDPSLKGEIPFGGMHILTLDSSVCDCGGNLHMIEDYRTGDVIDLYKSESSIFYEYFNADGIYQLGSYSTDSEPCSIYVYEDCVDIDNDGTYGKTPGTGTTLQ